MRKKEVKIYFSKSVAWFVLIITFLSLLLLFFANEYAPQSKKIPPLIFILTVMILILVVIFTFLATYKGMPYLIIKK